ncbi:MAG: hypothetical protein KGO98_05745 [Rickettsiales bacterium]|nr:hypothetical protein [Rickettsiales bacterium]
MSMTARGLFITLICLSWNRKCEWVKIDEAKVVASRHGVTHRRFEMIKKELVRYIAKDVFVFRVLQEMMDEAIELGNKNRRNANIKWQKHRENQMRAQSNIDINTEIETELDLKTNTDSSGIIN